MADDDGFTSLVSQAQLLSTSLQNVLDVLEKKSAALQNKEQQVRKETQVNLEKREKLDAIIKKWNTLADKLNQTNAISPIKLNIGGTTFCTSLETLTSTFSKGSYFEAMLSGRRNVNVGDNKEVFIDRDPTFFRYILNFMRGDMPDIEVLSVSVRSGLAQEAQFYCLTGLMDYMKTDSKSIIVRCQVTVEPSTISLPKSTFNNCFCPGPNHILKKNGKEATCLQQEKVSQNGCIVFGPWPRQHSLTNFKIGLTKQGQIAIGLAPQNINQIEGPTFQKGFFFYCKNQQVYLGRTGCNIKSYGYCQPSLSTGTTVGVKFDENVVSFIVNNCVIGNSYVIPENYRLCVLMFHAGDKIELL